MIGGAGRRDFLRTSVQAIPGLFAASRALAVPTRAVPPPLDRVASDEAYWREVAAHYRVARRPINLDGGYCGVMPEPVLASYEQNVRRVNELNSPYLRRRYEPDDREQARAAVAAALGVPSGEVALTRNATEALQNLILNYNRLTPGDSILYADLDYHGMQYAMDRLASLRGVRVVRIAVPEPPSRSAVLGAYRRAMNGEPRLKLMLLTHVSHRTGLVTPVREIAEEARSRGIDVILDAAHSWGSCDFTFADLGVDFAGFNLHKWIEAPLGVGFMVIRSSRLRDIDLHLGDRDYGEGDIRSRVHSGTVAVPSVLTVESALEFQRQVGWRKRCARLRYLRDYWVSQMRSELGIEILTSDQPGMSGPITSFRVRGMTSIEENRALAGRLLREFGIFTVERTGVAAGACIRVTPTIRTELRELDLLVSALRQVARESGARKAGGGRSY